jgi:GcrA cell cycle regulator
MSTFEQRQADERRAVTPRQLVDWTEARIDLVRTRWAEGISAANIAFELGGGISRSAVIGKVHRLKLTQHGRQKPPRPHGNKGQPKAKSIIKRVAARQKIAAAPLPPAEPYVEQQDEGVDVTALIGLLKLTDQTCKFPIGDPLLPGFGFCGKQPEPEKVYCAHHCAKAYHRPGVSK